MKFISEIFSADGLTKIAGLGAGDLASKAIIFHGAKFISTQDPEAKNKMLGTAAKALPLVSTFIGSYLSTRPETISRAVGNGMIASSIGGLIGPLIDKDGTMGIGSVFLAGPYTYTGPQTEVKQGATQPFMSGSSSFSNGEMSY